MIPHIASGYVRQRARQGRGYGLGVGVGVGWTAGFFWMVMVTVTEVTALVMLGGRVSRTPRVMVEKAPSTAIGVRVRLLRPARSSAEPVMVTKSGSRVMPVIR